MTLDSIATTLVVRVTVFICLLRITRFIDGTLYRWREQYTSRIRCATQIALRTPVYYDFGHRELRSGIKYPGAAVNRYDYTATLRALDSALREALPTSLYSQRSQTSSETNVTAHHALAELPLSEASFCVTLSPRLEVPLIRSLNLLWVEESLTRGIPRELLGRYASGATDTAWVVSEESQLLSKLLAHLGLIPLMCEQNPGPSVESRKGWRLSSQCDWALLTRQDQLDLARYVSQVRVFDMGYPTADRSWGPFLLVSSTRQDAKDPYSAAGYRRRRTRTISILHTVHGEKINKRGETQLTTRRSRLHTSGSVHPSASTTARVTRGLGAPCSHSYCRRISHGYAFGMG